MKKNTCKLRGEIRYKRGNDGEFLIKILIDFANIFFFF